MRPPSEDVDLNAASLAVLEADAAATLEELRAEAREAAEEARAASTERAYGPDWGDFSAFCVRIGRDLPFTADPLTLYLAISRISSGIAVYRSSARIWSRPP